MCTWNDATANWTVAADWSNCNGTIPGNGDDVSIPVGNPTLTTSATVGSVTVTTPGAWTITGASGSANISAATNSGTVQLNGAAKLNDYRRFCQ